MDTHDTGLTDKQEMFCQEYLVDLNGTQAAIRAGYSEDSATPDASRLLTYANVQSRLAALKAERVKRCQVSQDEVIQELRRCGFSDMRHFANWNDYSVTLKSSDTLTDDDAACIESLGQTVTKDGGSLSFKLHSKTKSLELLARHLGMLNDKFNIGGQKDNPLHVINDNDLERELAELRKSQTVEDQGTGAAQGEAAPTV